MNVRIKLQIGYLKWVLEVIYQTFIIFQQVAPIEKKRLDGRCGNFRRAYDNDIGHGKILERMAF